MEYEMESESGLFDASTNPSLLQMPARAVRDRKVQDRRKPQRAEVIPEEEDQAA